jgi:RNA polymerase sigma-70 factor (sigma-E family)
MTFEEFATARLDRLLGAAWAICGEHVLAEDLVQDVLLKVQAQWPRIETLDNRDAYVRKMLVNQYLSWRRRQTRIAFTSRQPDRRVEPDHAERHAEREGMRAALSRLPRQQRVVLALRYYEGLTDAEIADVMGCTAGTVRGYASRALAALRTRADDVARTAGERDG